MVHTTIETTNQLPYLSNQILSWRSLLQDMGRGMMATATILFMGVLLTFLVPPLG